jgi:hypothetical protein
VSSPSTGPIPSSAAASGWCEGQEVPIRSAPASGAGGALRAGLLPGTDRRDELSPLRRRRGPPLALRGLHRGPGQAEPLPAVARRRDLHPPGDRLRSGMPGAPDRHTIGFDFDFYTSQALGRYNAQIEGFMIFHTDPVRGRGPPVSGAPGPGVPVELPQRPDPAALLVPGLRHGLGSGGGIRQRRDSEGTSRRSPSPRAPAVGLDPADRAALLRVPHRHGQPAPHRNLDFTLLQVNFESGDRFQHRGRTRVRAAQRPFTIHGSGEDAIRSRRATTTPGPGPRGSRPPVDAPCRVASTWAAFGLLDGTRTQMVLRQGTIRPRGGVSLSTDYQRNEVRLPRGTSTRTWSVSRVLEPEPADVVHRQRPVRRRLSRHGALRPGPLDRPPGNDIFLVWTHNWQNEVARLLDREFTTLSRVGR